MVESNVLQLLIVVVGTIGGFNGVGKGNVQLTHQDCSGSGIIKFTDFKDATIESKHFSVILQQLWKKTAIIVMTVSDGIFRAIHEHVFSSPSGHGSSGIAASCP